MFYVIDKKNKLSIFDDNKETLEKTREFMPQLEGQYTLETNIVTENELKAHPNKVIVDNIDIQIDVPDFDKEDNPVSSHEITIIKHKQQTHKETIRIKGLVLNPDYEQEEAEKEAVRIANLHLTRGDVFRGLLLAKGVTRAELRALIELMPEDTPEQKIQKEMALIDFDEALEFYRGVALAGTLASKLGINSKQMDRFFETNDWQALVSEE